MFQDLIPKKNNQQSGALDFSDLIPKKTLPQRAFEGARTLAGTLVQPIESTVRNVVAPPVAGIMSLAKDTSFQDEYAQYRNKLNLPENMSVTGLISGGTVQPTTRDILTQKGALQATGDVITALPIVKGAKIATGIAKTIAPLAGKATANIVAGAGLGYLTDVGMDLQEGQGVGEALTPGAGTAIGTAIPLAPYVIRTLGSVGKKVGEKVVGAVIPKSTKEAQILTTYKANKPFLERVTDVLKGESLPPQTASKTTVEKGLMGTKSMIGVQATRASNKLWKDVINPSLKASPERVDLPKFFDTIRTRIITDNPDLGRQRVLLEALDAVKDDYKGISTIDMSQLQKFKEGWAKFVPEKAYRGKPIAGAYNDVRNQLADEARQTIYTTLGDDIKQAYFDYGNLKDLQEMGITSMTGQKLKGGAGSFMYELFSQSVTPIGTIAGRAIYKLANGMEIVGKAGARTLEEALELKPQVLTQPITQQPSQTIANQNKMFPIISNIDNTIPQSIENVEKVQEAVKLFNKRFGEEVLTPDDNFGIDLVKFYDRMQGASSKQKADITAELYKEILKGNCLACAR